MSPSRPGLRKTGGEGVPRVLGDGASDPGNSGAWWASNSSWARCRRRPIRWSSGSDAFCTVAVRLWLEPVEPLVDWRMAAKTISGVQPH